VYGIVLRFGFGGWDTAKTVHEALLVVPGHVVGGDEFDVGEVAQKPAAKRRVGTDAFVLVEPDGGLGQSVSVGITHRSHRGSQPRK